MAAGMSKLDQYLERYGEHHRHPVNKTIHWVAVPLIMFSLLGLVWMIPFPPVTTFLNWASFLIAFSIYYYWTLSRLMAMTMVLIVGVMSYFIIRIELTAGQPALVFAAIFVGAWILQFIGHKIEGKKPSFLEDVKFLLIGPLWLLHFVFKKLGISYN